MSDPMVFIVDHDQAFLELMNEALADEGYIPAVWGEFSRAYDLIRRARPSLVVLEVSPVDPDAGCGVLSQLQQNEITEHIPVLLTSTDPARLGRRLAQWNIDGSEVLAKPFDLDELLARLRSLRSHPDSMVANGRVPAGEAMALC